MKIGMLGGTGFYELLKPLEPIQVMTEYGDVTLFQGISQGKEVYFLPRHGKTHNTLAPYVQYKSNMLALKQVGVERILAISAVGSINPDINIGSLCVLDQFVDLTRRREKTYGKMSVDMSEPFCSDLRDTIIRSAKNQEIPVHTRATLICVDGPIYETKSELQLYAQWGMDVVGMTNSTESVLARELGMCYSVVTLSTDMATGSAPIPPDLATHKKVAKDNEEKVRQLFQEVLCILNEEKLCNCQQIYTLATSRH